MRKRDPDAVVQSFLDDLRTLEASTVELIAWARKADFGRVYTDALMRLAVAWEVFRSDWYIACINRDSSAMRSHVEATVKEQMEKAQRGAARGAWDQGWVQVSVPRHPTLEQIAAALDPNSYNLSLPKDIRKDGGLLSQPYAGRVAALDGEDDLLIGATLALRNVIAHRSRSSIDRLNVALRGLDASRDPGLALSANAPRVDLGGWCRTGVAGRSGAAGGGGGCCCVAVLGW